MGFRILLVNAELETQRLFQEALSTVNAQLVIPESAESAGRQIREEKFEAIFIDSSRLGGSRQGFTRLVRASRFNSQVPVVFLTGHRGPRALEGEMPEGVTMMVRPANAGDLERFLKELKRKIIAERRGHRRLSLRTSVLCLQGVRKLRAISVNLSTTGLLIEAGAPFQRDEEWEVQFMLVRDEPVFRARARVLRVGEQNRVGLRFLSLGVHDRERLRQFLDKHLPALRWSGACGLASEALGLERKYPPPDDAASACVEHAGRGMVCKRFPYPTDRREGNAVVQEERVVRSTRPAV